MRCDEAAEFVSALCDDEVVPRAAAEHMRTCAFCQARLQEYMEMSAGTAPYCELRNRGERFIADLDQAAKHSCNLVAERMGNHENTEACIRDTDRRNRCAVFYTRSGKSSRSL